jgi:hypothetical protein
LVIIQDSLNIKTEIEKYLLNFKMALPRRRQFDGVGANAPRPAGKQTTQHNDSSTLRESPWLCCIS